MEKLMIEAAINEPYGQRSNASTHRPDVGTDIVHDPP